MKFLTVATLLLSTVLASQGSPVNNNVTDFSVIAQKIKAVEWRLARGIWNSGPNQGVATFSTVKNRFDALVAKGDIKKTMDLGYVAKGSRELSVVCPLLFKLTIYQERRGNQRTFIAANSIPTPITKGMWVPEREFFCAPYVGYCGADTLLWGMQSWQPYYSIMHTVDENEVVQNSVGDNYPYRLCYIWGI